MFDEPPVVDSRDWLDGDSLELLSGKNYRELVPLLTKELDVFPLFALIPHEAGRYYLASALIAHVNCLQGVVDCRNPKYRWMHEAYCLIGTIYISMIEFLRRKETVEWILLNEDLRRLIGDVFDTTNELLSDLEESNLKDVRQIISELRASC